MGLKELKEKRLRLIEQNKTLTETILGEDRAWTEDEETRYNDALEEIRKLDDMITAFEANADADKRASAPVGNPIKPEPETVTVGDTREAQKPFRHLGEQLLAIRNAAESPDNTDVRLHEIQKRTMYENQPSTGGFLLQEDFATELLKMSFDTGLLPGRCRPFTISAASNSIKIPALNEFSRADGSRGGGVSVYWKNEGALKTSSDSSFMRVQMELNKLIGLYEASDEVLNDAVALQSLMTMLFTSEFGFTLDEAIFTGDGAGKPLGILNAPCLKTVAKETGQPAATIQYENVNKMWFGLYPRSRANAVWLVGVSEVERVLSNMVMVIGTGGVPVYLPPSGVSGSPYGTLYNRPVIPFEHCSALGTIGDIVLADFSHYLLARKGGLETAASIHVRFKYDEQTFRFVMRVDGQPWWSDELTLKDGSTTVSPFVALATRS